MVHIMLPRMLSARHVSESPNSPTASSSAPMKPSRIAASSRADSRRRCSGKRTPDRLSMAARAGMLAGFPTKYLAGPRTSRSALRHRIDHEDAGLEARGPARLDRPHLAEAQAGQQDGEQAGAREVHVGG